MKHLRLIGALAGATGFVILFTQYSAYSPTPPAPSPQLAAAFGLTAIGTGVFLLA